MPSALFLSPHLDDVAFSCSGTLMLLRERGWDVHLVTVFTQSVPKPQGFALQCQTDKGLSPNVDYMKLRRDEDFAFAQKARIESLNVHHWPLPEAPHRGYKSASELFAGVHPDDEIWREVVALLRVINSTLKPNIVFVPQGLGNHVDHVQVIRATLETSLENFVWYRDTPYAIREPQAQPSSLLPQGLEDCSIDISRVLERKIEGCRAYASQIDFQFGGADEVARKLRLFHASEASVSEARVSEAFVSEESGELCAKTNRACERFLAWPDTIEILKSSLQNS